MRTIIAIILTVSALTSCGRNEILGKTVETEYEITAQGAYLQCSYNQTRMQCLDYVDNKLIGQRFFYYAQCYSEYLACIRGYGY